MSEDKTNQNKLVLVELYERLLKGETSAARRRGILKELLGRYDQLEKKKPEVTEEFVEKWTDKFDGIAQQGLIIFLSCPYNLAISLIVNS
ncbi:unnamed protein product [marine sediment metagenome]|uniref:Uncharacterized protein n=1 Tax=marine sediment metagenome TaxID=412755 RepID=X1GQ18_9ZZZZ